MDVAEIGLDARRVARHHGVEREPRCVPDQRCMGHAAGEAIADQGHVQRRSHRAGPRAARRNVQGQGTGALRAGLQRSAGCTRS